MNSIFIIKPYKYNGTWVFDDPQMGLYREPFVSGISVMIDLLVFSLPNSDKGFKLTFSDNPFPGHEVELVKTREDTRGSWYRISRGYVSFEGCLSDALQKYFSPTPERIYAKVDEI